jgi:hypothetical protein
MATTQQLPQTAAVIAATAGQTAQHGSASARRRARASAAGGATIANIAVWTIASAFGVDFKLADSTGEAVVNLPTTIAFTLLFGMLGWGSLALLERFTRRARTVWTALATAVLLLSFVPICLEHASTGTKISLSLIHLTVAAVIVPVMRRSARRTGRV